MKIEEYDILIMGSGPSGSAAALATGKTGLKTIIIDRSEFPRDKVCGDAFVMHSLNLLKENGLNFDSIQQLNSYVSNKSFLFEDYSGKQFHIDNPNIFQCKRYEIDNILAKSVPENVDKIVGCEVSNLVELPNQEGYEIHITSNENSRIIHAKYLIGADGYSSFVRRNLFSKLKFKSRKACRYYFQDENLKQDHLGFHFYPEINPGYFWVFPIGKNEFNSGLYLPHDSNLNIETTFQKYYSKLFNREADKNEISVWPIPNNANLNILTNGRALLTGDAAGLCDYLIGHGIDTAILSGLLAVKAITFFHTKNFGKYSFEEIYAYELNAHMGNVLTRSEKLYYDLESKSNSLESIVEQYIKGYDA